MFSPGEFKQNERPGWLPGSSSVVAAERDRQQTDSDVDGVILKDANAIVVLKPGNDSSVSMMQVEVLSDIPAKWKLSRFSRSSHDGGVSDALGLH